MVTDIETLRYSSIHYYHLLHASTRSIEIISCIHTVIGTISECTTRVADTTQGVTPVDLRGRKEMMMNGLKDGTGLCGVVFSLLGVQPLAIIAFTGPLLLFEEIIIEFAELLQIEYLPWRACIGLWLMLMILAFAVTESTFLVKHFSRFSEEVFSGVIALFFTVEAGRNLVNVSPLPSFNPFIIISFLPLRSTGVTPCVVSATRVVHSLIVPITVCMQLMISMDLVLACRRW